ncbi:MAG: ATP-binding protein [Candidatus Aminicenantes bacterium]|nr:ATP-binding protein [Candidatus Aminicenantes bacterium]
MEINLKKRESTAIINSLLAGVVPRTGVQHITVGRTKEIDAALKCLDDVKAGHSLMRFWIGEFGSGKSFMLYLLNILARKQKFVTASVDFSPEKRLYANDRKAVAVYSSLMDNLAINTKPEGGALLTLLEKWIEQVVLETAQAHQIPFAEIRDEKNAGLVKQNIMNTVNKITDINAFDFGVVILKYYEGYMSKDDVLCKNALKWLKGEYTTRVEARRDLGVRTIINDRNYYEMLKNFTIFFTYIGYSGFMINFDEALSLYKITHSPTREKNYEKILSIYNDCFQGKIGHLLINIAGANEFLEDRRRGLYSLEAIRTRLEGNKYETQEARDFAQPVIKLLPLTHDEIFVLLQKLKTVFDFHYGVESAVDDNDIKSFMDSIYNKPGADEFLTPRDVIKEFLSILSILRQNPHLDKERLFRANSLEIMKELGIELGIEEY